MDPTDDLFASKSLDLTWLSPAFGSPCFVRSGESSLWFWRVDELFGTWLSRVLDKAAARNIVFPAHEVANAAIVRNYLEERRAGSWAECERLAKLGPVKLPDEVCADYKEFARFDFFPAAVGTTKPAWVIEFAKPEREAVPETVGPLTLPPKAAPVPQKPKPAAGCPRQPAEVPTLF